MGRPLGVAPILTEGWSSVWPHHAPSRAGPAGFLALCYLVAPFNMQSRSRASMSLTPAAVTLPSAEAIAVARSAAYVCAAGMNSAHAAHTYVRCARACCGAHAM